MCESKANGGHRCAAHTREDYLKVRNLLKLPAEQRPANLATLIFSAAVEHASSPAGFQEIAMDADRANGNPLGILLRDAATRGRAAIAARQATNNVVRARKSLGAPRVTPRGYTLGRHILEQAAAKGISLDALIAAVDKPITAYESYRYPGQRKHIRDGICVAVDIKEKNAITVFIDKEYTDVRADQTDADAQKYAQKKADGKLPPAK